jgi:hypothetical protein
MTEITKWRAKSRGTASNGGAFLPHYTGGLKEVLRDTQNFRGSRRRT